MLPQWINSRTLVLVDSHEKLQVVDRPSQEVLETVDLEQVQLVYNSRHFKSLATGGNVSQALVREGWREGCFIHLKSDGNEHLQGLNQSAEQSIDTPHRQSSHSGIMNEAFGRVV